MHIDLTRTVGEILADVDDDPNLAAVVLDAENDSPDPRPELVAALEDIINTGGDPSPEADTEDAATGDGNGDDTAAPADDDPSQVDVSGTVDEVLAHVDGDVDKAIAALAAEQAKPKPRKSLVVALGDIITPPDSAAETPAAGRVSVTVTRAHRFIWDGRVVDLNKDDVATGALARYLIDHNLEEDPR